MGGSQVRRCGPGGRYASSIHTGRFVAALTKRLPYMLQFFDRGTPADSFSHQTAAPVAVESRDMAGTNDAHPLPPEARSAIETVEQYLRQGEPLLAYNAVQEGLHSWPGNLRL